MHRLFEALRSPIASSGIVVFGSSSSDGTVVARISELPGKFWKI